MRPRGQLAVGERNFKELKKMANWEGKQNLRVILWDKSAIVWVEVFSSLGFSSKNGSENYYVREKCCGDELLLPLSKYHGLTFFSQPL